jgi:hypothetical protein
MRSVKPAVLIAPGLAVVLLLGLAGPAGGGVVLNEIYYNQPGSAEEEEFVELLNAGDAPADLSGWRLTRGVFFEFPAGTVLGAGGLLVIAADPVAFGSAFPGVLGLGPYEGRLDNGGERISLAFADGSVVDEVEYDDGEDWPQAADGDGASLELVRPGGPLGVPAIWAAGSPPTPGAPNRAAGRAPVPTAFGVTVEPERVTTADTVVVRARVFSEEPLASVVLRLGAGAASRDVPMHDDGASFDVAAGDGLFTASVEPQPDLTLVKFKVVLTGLDGVEHTWPPGNDESDSYAWFVEDAGDETEIPTVRIFLSAAKLQLLADYAQIRSASDPLYPKFDTTFDGFSVIEGKVHRKTAIRHRGGFASRHAGRLKYSWLLRFPDWARYQGRESLIIQGNMHWDDPFMRGDNGLRDKLCCLTFDRAGAPSPRTRFIRLVVNNEFFGYHVELEDIDGTFLERNGFSGLGDLYKHGRTASAHLFPQPAESYPISYEKQGGADEGDYSSLRVFCDGLAAAGGSAAPGTVTIAGRIWRRDSGTRPADPTFSSSGLSGFATARRSAGLLAWNCQAEFDDIFVRAADGGDLLAEDGAAIDDWAAVEGDWVADGVVRLESPAAAAYRRIARLNVLDLDRQPITVTFDVRITSPKAGDCWAGMGVFLGNPTSYAAEGAACTVLRHGADGSEGLHLLKAGSGALNGSGRFAWAAGEWYRVEHAVSVRRAGDENDELLGYLEANVDLDELTRYTAAIALCTHWDSTNQNYFFYRDDLDDGRWVMFPWDMDITWGYSRRKPPPAQGHNLHPLDGTRWNPEPNEYGTNALREAILGLPTLRDAFEERLAEALVSYFTEAEIGTVVDRILATDGEESQRDIDKWNALDGSWDWKSFAYHAAFDETFVAKRRKYLAEFLHRPPMLSQPSADPGPTGLAFRVNVLGSRYDGSYDTGLGNLERVSLHILAGGRESEVPMAAADSGATDFYEAAVSGLEGASRVHYRFSAADDEGREGFLPDPTRDGFRYYLLDLSDAPPGAGDIAVNEIMYHARHYDIEFIELKNNLYRPADISGWVVSIVETGERYALPAGSIIGPAGYLVLSRDRRAVFEYYGIVDLAGSDLPFSLGNKGATIEVRDAGGVLVESVRYEDGSPWPEAADGEGPSLERIDSRKTAAWLASDGQGTPGRPNSKSAPEIPPQPSEAGTPFHRGDAEGDGAVDITDGIYLLESLFLGGESPSCLEAADAGNDGGIDIADPILLFTYLFLSGPPPPDPGPPGSPCGPDPDPPGSEKDLGCDRYDGCR